MKLIWKCSSQQCASPWLVVFQARPIVFDKIGCKNLGEVKWPAGQNESDWSILNLLNRRYSNVSARAHWRVHWNVMSLSITHRMNDNVAWLYWQTITCECKHNKYQTVLSRKCNHSQTRALNEHSFVQYTFIAPIECLLDWQVASRPLPGHSVLGL